MESFRKTVALILVFSIAFPTLSLLTIKPANAQSLPTPAVPEFSVAYVNSSYYVPLTYNYSTNPYTGQQVTTTQGGYYVENQTINVTIKNQPFTPITMDGNTTQLYYVIRWKGHFENWTSDDDFNDINYNSNGNNFYDNSNYGIQTSNADYTVITYPLETIGSVPNGGQVDFQVKAQAGYTFTYYGGHIQPIGIDYHYVAQSDWSNTQTLTINYNSNSTSSTYSPSPTQSPNTTPLVPELSPATITVAFSVATIALVLYKRKKM